MSKASTVHCVIKFGPRLFMEEFQTKGRLYMNTLRYFKRLEADDRLRADKSEGLYASFPANRMSISVGSTKLERLVGQVRFGHPNEDEIAIFSMYAITGKNKDVIVDDRILGFGDTAVVLIKGDQFTERVKRECEKRGWRYEMNLVDYVDKETHEGEMGPFRKYADLAYQSEYRIAVSTGKRGTVDDFFIGDISDITHLCESAIVKLCFKS